MSPWEFVLGALAAYRLARLLTVDSLLDDLRAWVALKCGDRVETLITCPFCAGWWVSVAVVLVLAGWGQVGRWLLLPWAVAGAQSLLASADSRMNT